MSRTALLDIFLAFFVVAAVACLAADRDWFRNRLADHLVRRGAARPRPAVRSGAARSGRGGSPPASASGLALGTKWNALYVLAAFALLVAGLGRRRPPARRGGPAREPGRRPRRRRRRSSPGRGLRSASTSPPGPAGSPPVRRVRPQLGRAAPRGRHDASASGAPLASLLHYQRDIWNFHTGDFINHAQHAYRANPIGWLVLARPIGDRRGQRHPARHRGCAGPGQLPQRDQRRSARRPCGGWRCSRWSRRCCCGSARRDWRFGIPVVGVLSGWLPWFQYDSRPLFFFYAIMIIPFSVMAVALCRRTAARRRPGRRPPDDRRRSSPGRSSRWSARTSPTSTRSSPTAAAPTRVAHPDVVPQLDLRARL